VIKHAKTMKKILLILSTVLTGACCVAQSAAPRYGATPHSDNTGRVLNYKYKAIADTAGTTTDTLNLYPSGWENDYRLALTDSCALSCNTSNSYYGDQLLLDIENTTGAGHRVYFSYGAWSTLPSAGAYITLASGKKAYILFRFNGTAWVEQYRMVQ
jgi:hypothetical protein